MDMLDFMVGFVIAVYTHTDLWKIILRINRFARLYPIALSLDTLLDDRLGGAFCIQTGSGQGNWDVASR